MRDTRPNIYLPPAWRRCICFALEREIDRLRQSSDEACDAFDERCVEMDKFRHQSIIDHIRSLD